MATCSDVHEPGLGVLLVVHGDGGADPVLHGVREGSEGALGVAHHADGASRVQNQNLRKLYHLDFTVQESYNLHSTLSCVILQ